VKRIALISSAFYPYPQVAAVRATNWARMLPELGYEVVVVTRDTGHRASPQRLANEVHSGVELLSLLGDGTVAPQVDSYPPKASATRLANTKLAWKRRLDGWWIPSGNIRYWRKVYPKVQQLIRERRCDAILTTSPMSATAEVGRWLGRDLGLPWIADFRDPPLLDERSRPAGWSRLMLPRHRAWLDSVYKESDAIIHAIPTHGRWARSVYPTHRHKCAILRHPIPRDLAAGEVEPIFSESPNRRSICVVGSLEIEGLKVLAQAVALLVARDAKQFDLELRLVGRPLNDPRPIEALLGDRLVWIGRVENSVAKQHLLGADVLVNAVSPERQRYLGVSSKLFEYAAARRPIVVINPTRPDRHLVWRLPAQTIHNPTPDEMAAALGDSLAMDRKQVAEAVEPFLQANSWQRHGERLAEVIECVTDPTRQPFDLREL